MECNNVVVSRLHNSAHLKFHIITKIQTSIIDFNNEHITKIYDRTHSIKTVCFIVPTIFSTANFLLFKKFQISKHRIQ